jgi:hypothetical protein
MPGAAIFRAPPHASGHMPSKQPLHVFSATIRKIDINPYVKVPGPILQKLQQAAQKAKGPIPVRGTLQGKPFSTNVVRFRGLWRLYLNTPMRRAAGVDVGDDVTVGVRFDPVPRTVPIRKRSSWHFQKTKAPGRPFGS